MDRVPWYSATIQDPSRVRIDGIDSANFLTDFTNQIYFANGALCDVFNATPVKGVCVLLSLTQPCVDESHFKGEFTMFCTSPLWLEAASKGEPLFETKQQRSHGQAHIPARSHPRNSYTHVGEETAEAEGGMTKNSSNCLWTTLDNMNCEGDCRDSTPFHIVYVLLVIAVLVGLFYLDLYICMVIGATADKWAYVFAWLFTGNIVYCVVCGGVIPLIISYMSLKKPMVLSCAAIIIMFLLSCCFGAPMAWFEGHQKALNGYLEPDKFKSLNCWRNPTESFSQTAHHFIQLEEPEWFVDYRVRDTQKISILKEQDDDDGDLPGRHNYCVAPIKYKGAPHCPQDFYAACYRKTDVYSLLSCSDADATTCGWQYNSAGNILRTLNRNEEFFADLNGDDEGNWRKAFNLAPHPIANPASSIIGYYSGAGPFEIEEMADKKAEMRDLVFLIGMVSYTGVILIMVIIVRSPCAKRELF